jgi:transposase
MGRHQSNIIHLTENEKSFLIEHCKKGDWSPRIVIRAQILLLADHNVEPLLDHEIAKRLNISLSSVRYRRRRFAETRSIEDTLFDKARPGRPTIIDGAIEAHMTVIACSQAPKGHAKWTLRLIKDRMLALDVIDSISHTTVGRTLKKKKLNLG